MLTRLVLTREPGQSVTLDWCGETIGTIELSRIQNNKVRLAFAMEQHVRILRTELLERATDAGEDESGGVEGVEGVAEAAMAVYVPLDPAGLY